MNNYYVEDFERMKEGVGRLKEAVNRFLEETLTPVIDEIKDSKSVPVEIELKLHSLVEKTTDLATSFSPLEQRIEDINVAGANLYSIAGLANELGSTLEEWQSGFAAIKDKWVSISELIGQPRPSVESAKPEDLLKAIIGECGSIQQSLQEILLKLFVYRRLEPSIKKISDQVSELKTKLQNLVKDWLPQTEQMQQLIEPLIEQATQLSDNSDLINNDTETKFSNLLEKHRSLYEFFARWQLFKKIEPTLHTSLSQLENLEQSFEEALTEWRPTSEEIKRLYDSILTKYKELNTVKKEESPLDGKYEALASGFDQLEEEWNLALKDISVLVNNWVNRR